jgi:hypothetical protein
LVGQEDFVQVPSDYDRVVSKVAYPIESIDARLQECWHYIPDANGYRFERLRRCWGVKLNEVRVNRGLFGGCLSSTVICIARGMIQTDDSKN